MLFMCLMLEKTSTIAYESVNGWNLGHTQPQAHLQWNEIRKAIIGIITNQIENSEKYSEANT